MSASRIRSLPVCVVALAILSGGVAQAKGATRKGSFVDVRTYLPAGYVTDGSVDYRQPIQKCLDENAYVYFPGSNDHKKPMVYGSTVGLKTRPFSVIRFGTNAIVRRLPSFGELLHLGKGTHLIGAVIDGNKYAHWPLMKDREIKPYAYAAGTDVVLGGQNVLKDCFVYNNAGIAFGAWGTSDNKIYRSRAENCGFLEAMGQDFWGGEHASGDGFLFTGGSAYNIVKDCEAYDCSRWGFVITEGARDTTFVDCRGGNIHFYCFGFIDVEGAGPGNSLIRCRSHNSHINADGYHQELIGCVASHISVQNASYVRVIACTTTGGHLLVGGTLDSLQENQKPSAMVAFNRVYLSRPSTVGGLRVVCSDGKAIVTNNVVYAYQRGRRRAEGLVLQNVGVNRGNLVAYGLWDKEIAQFRKGYYLRAHVDYKFLQKRKEEVSRRELAAYLPKLGIQAKATYQKILLGEFPFKLDLDDVGTAEKWYDPAHRPRDLQKAQIGRHWRTDHVHGELGPGWHFVKFDLPAAHKGKQVFLHFGAMDGDAQAYLNGERLGRHDDGDSAAGWIEPFHFDATQFVRAGRNDLAIRVTTISGLIGPYKAISVVVK